jgi:hypothetical protein
MMAAFSAGILSFKSEFVQGCKLAVTLLSIFACRLETLIVAVWLAFPIG